jgi:translation initiation factor 2 beta subunit (eIF-2beta)/eIF-5
VNGSKTAHFVIALSVSLGALACNKQQPPLTASSADQGTYALHYADSLSSARSELATIEKQTDAVPDDFAKYPDALSNPSWPDVLAVYQRADEAGHSAAYVEELERARAVTQFYTEEKDELNRRVGGAAQYAVKQKECDVDVTGSTSYALQKAFDERVRDRLRDHSDAYVYIDEHEDTLGKKNRPKLEDQSDAIAQMSYLVHIRIVELRDALARQASEASDVESTLQKIADEAHAAAADPKATAARRTHETQREQAALSAKQRVEPEVAEAKKLSQEFDKRISAVQDKYQDALKALERDVKNRADAAPPPAAK